MAFFRFDCFKLLNIFWLSFCYLFYDFLYWNFDFVWNFLFNEFLNNFLDRNMNDFLNRVGLLLNNSFDMVVMMVMVVMLEIDKIF